MLAPEDIRHRAETRYADFLRSVVNETTFFPLPIRFGKPSATEDFAKLRREINALTEANLGCNIEWIEVNSRRWGKQRLPERVEFVDEASYLRAIGKAKEVAHFRENVKLTHERCPALVSHLVARPLDAVEFADAWPGLLEVCAYLQLNPRPNVYARELPLSVDTKFIERNQAVLCRLLTVALSPETIVDADRFEDRFGLRFDEPQIRIRLLDESLKSLLAIPFSDFSIPVSAFRKLHWKKLRCVIAENKMTFLTLPLIAHGIGIWGAGNAAALLHDATWLSTCRIFYWGDLDTQGLEILSRLRSVFPSVKSVMMDTTALRQFRTLCCYGTQCKSPLPLNLTEPEQTAWSVAQAENLRLEQERIPTAYAQKQILDIVS